MFNVIFNIVWWGLMAWTCVVPDGYGPYVLLGLNVGDVVATLWFGLGYGYLTEEGDFNLERFVGTSVAFGLLGGFYAGKLSFQPGTDAYNNALTLIFFSFCFAFGYRYLQYGIKHFLRQY